MTHDQQQFKCVVKIGLFELPVMMFLQFKHKYQTQLTTITKKNKRVNKNILLIFIVISMSDTAMTEDVPYGSVNSKNISYRDTLWSFITKEL